MAFTKLKRSRKLLIEPPTSATGDIAFNLIVFFLVCVSVQPDSGIKQVFPSSEQTQEQNQEENLTVDIDRRILKVNGEPVAENQFEARLKSLLAGKTSEQDRVVVYKPTNDVEFARYLKFQQIIVRAGGILSEQKDEEQEVVVPR